MVFHQYERVDVSLVLNSPQKPETLRKKESNLLKQWKFITGNSNLVRSFSEEIFFLDAKNYMCH